MDLRLTTSPMSIRCRRRSVGELSERAGAYVPEVGKDIKQAVRAWTTLGNFGTVDTVIRVITPLSVATYLSLAIRVANMPKALRKSERIWDGPRRH